jgi:hypothetical protein
MASLTVYSVNLQNVPSGFNPLNTSTTSFQYLTSTLIGQTGGQFPGQGQMTIMISNLLLPPLTLLGIDPIVGTVNQQAYQDQHIRLIRRF